MRSHCVYYIIILTSYYLFASITIVFIGRVYIDYFNPLMLPTSPYKNMCLSFASYSIAACPFNYTTLSIVKCLLFSLLTQCRFLLQPSLFKSIGLVLHFSCPHFRFREINVAITRFKLL